MSLLSRLFPKTPAQPPEEPVVAPEPVLPPPRAVDPAENDRLLQAIASGAVTPPELARLAVEGPTTRVRQAAAAAIEDPALWRNLLPRLRGRDKAAYRLIRERADAVLADQRRLEQAAQEAAALCASIEKHGTRVHDAIYAATLASLASRWEALPEPVDAAVRERGEQALARCRAVIAAHARELARLACEHEAAEARARAEDAERQALLQAAAEQAAAAASAQAAAEAARAAEAEALADREAEAARIQGEIVSLVRLSGAALQRGDTRKAARFRQSIEESLQAASALPPHLARSIEQLDARLNELRQWKDYVAAPKRIELIEEMEALIGAADEPQALAEHIRALQQQWRTINKGLATDASAEAQRFQQAYQAAFKPCQAFFAGQAALRRENLEARRRVLERVLAFEARLDAAQPDHALIARVLREAPQEWRSHEPVDRDASRSADTDFHRTLARLRERLAAWHSRNAADKEALLAEARGLAAIEDAAQAVDVVKRLQAQWKETGPVPPPQSQPLWDEFRALCNAVFERRQQAFAQQSATLEAAKQQAVALCSQVEQASREPPADRRAGEARLREWQEAFAAVGELPRAEVRGLRERYQRAVSRYEALLAGQEQRDAAAAESNLHAAARHVRACQRAVMQGAAADERAALRNAAEAFIAGVTRWPGKGAVQALRQGLSRADSASFTTADDATRERALRMLCIRAEILGSTATPPEDATLRRACELQLLSQGLGRARQMEERDWEAMRLEWLAIDAVAPEVHDALERRFLEGLSRRPTRPASAARRA
jgi:hypothetical protein